MSGQQHIPLRQPDSMSKLLVRDEEHGGKVGERA